MGGGVSMPSVKVLKEILSAHEKSAEWLKALPREIENAFFDNPYVVGMGVVAQELIDAYFGGWAELVYKIFEDHLSDEGVEGVYGIPPVGSFNRIIYVNGLDQLCEFLINNEGWTE